MSDFNWSAENLALTQQDATAIYRNENGDVVIRQRADFGEDDPIIVIGKYNLAAFIAALQAEAAEGE